MAFELALKRQAEREANKMQQSAGSGYQGPSKVTIVHKSNVLSVTDGLFRESVREVYGSDSRFSAIQMEEQLVDSMVYRMFREPE
jgi:homoisocitrate dehydrogenase